VVLRPRTGRARITDTDTEIVMMTYDGGYHGGHGSPATSSMTAIPAAKLPHK
jgi:hypothetical protein